MQTLREKYNFHPWQPPIALLGFNLIDDAAERQRLEKLYGQGNVWNTQEFNDKFNIFLCMGRFCAVTDMRTKKNGTIEFTGYPRFYFNYKES